MKNTSVLQINKRRQNQILKELTDGPLKPVISIFNKSQKAQKNPKVFTVLKQANIKQLRGVENYIPWINPDAQIR